MSISGGKYSGMFSPPCNELSKTPDTTWNLKGYLLFKSFSIFVSIAV